MKTEIICTCAAILMLTPLRAQEKVWSLADCIGYALENNISIRQKEIDVQNNEIALQVTKASRLPYVGASLGDNINIGRGQNRQGLFEDHSSNTVSVSANASIPVFQGFAINNQIKADRFSLEAATQDLEQARQDVSLNIVAYYLQVLYAKENQAVEQKQVEISRQLVERASSMVEQGRSSLSELYDAQSSLASAQSTYVEAQNSTDAALLDLAQAINWTDYGNFDVAFPDVETMLDQALVTLTPPDSIYLDYIDRRPSVIAAGKRVDRALSNVKVAQSDYWPSISFGVSYGTGYYSSQDIAGGGTFWNQLGLNGSTSIGASLNIPIFNRLSTTGRVKQAKNNARIEELALQQAKLDVFKEVQQAYINAKAALSKYEAGIKSVDAAHKAFEFEQKKYEAGSSTAYQFNEIRQKYVNAASQMSQAKYNFIMRSKILDFYKGEPLY